MRLTQRQETFCLKYFELGNASEAALIAGYSPRTVRAIASVNLTKVNIQTRLKELRQVVEDASVANVLERKQILTEIARGNLIDYQEVGADGGYLSIGKESPNTRAISEITSRTEYNKDESSAALVTKVKLHNPSQAIDLLNKMDGAYAPEKYFNVNVEITDLTDEELTNIITGRGSKRIDQKAESP